MLWYLVSGFGIMLSYRMNALTDGAARISAGSADFVPK